MRANSSEVRTEASAELGECLAYPPQRLADALVVLHEREAHEALAAGPEAHTRRDGDLGLLHEHLGELEAAELLVGLGDRRPHEHRAARLLVLPPAPGAAVDERVSPAEAYGVV